MDAGRVSSEPRFFGKVVSWRGCQGWIESPSASDRQITIQRASLTLDHAVFAHKSEVPLTLRKIGVDVSFSVALGADGQPAARAVRPLTQSELEVVAREVGPPANEGVLEPHEKRIFLLRHGQSEHNVGGNLHSRRSRPDPPLTALGCEQSNRWAVEMPKIAQPEVVLLSPLTRSIQTGLRAFQHCSAHFQVCRHARELPFQYNCNLPNQDLAVIRRMLESEPRGQEILALCGKKSHTGIPGTGGLQEGFTDLPVTDWDSTLHGKADERRWLADLDRVHHASLQLLLKELCHRQESTIAVSAHNETIKRILWPQEYHTDNCELVEAVLNCQTGQLTFVRSYQCPLAA